MTTPARPVAPSRRPLRPRTSVPRTSVPRTSLLLLLASFLTGAFAAPAAAHPFGDPQTLELSVEGHEVEVVWQAAPDDYTSLALRLGAVDGPRRMVFKEGAMVPETVDARDAELLGSSPRLGEYLLSTVRVAQREETCEGVLTSAAELAASGATLVFTCPEVVEEVEVTAAPLVDLHPAYTTLATGPGGATHVFTADDPSHVFSLEPAGATLREGGVTLAALSGGAAVLGLGTWAWRRRRATAGE